MTFLLLNHPFSFATEKAADDEVQKSDISSSSQGVIEKESLGPLLLEVGAQMWLMLQGPATALRKWNTEEEGNGDGVGML